ncbi:alpha/beta hydrolase domain-containing protein [Actinomadura sp. DC4]|uniref:alpha/beta hydrolase domain-containing protein n=1 Tax=Actinomadura sp. DC4 TaxID=3055069 RepID=UPI0025B25108|nr:alpha/beta hydrolase domain-containing protein [Actinomadura sp. DC4]MDN3353180.1 alpha/beta hydrolase domain-containing protein [Actinomadura sp. DC4]
MHRIFIAVAMATLILTAALGTGLTAHAEEDTPGPTVIGPVNGGTGRPFPTSPVPLDTAGYMEQEYFLDGTATGYVQADTWGSDGRWRVRPAEQSAFRTRLLVRRPADPARFNGTVIVEWLDLPGGVDVDPDFLYTHAELLRAGYAWVGVSAQQQGVTTLQRVDPGRYADLSHPGDTFSYSIYSQAAQALLHPAGIDPLGGLRPRTLIGDGYSGSSARLVTYINAVQPVDRLFSGFLVHSRWARSAPISQPPQAPQSSPSIVYTRTDSSAPVLTVATETEILQTHPSYPNLDYYPVSQPDSRGFRLWEVPGTSHVDATLDALLAAESGSQPTQCTQAANNGQESAVMSAALAQINRWIRTGVPAPTARRIQVTPDGTAIIRDGYGNALGGVRTPALDAPVATLTGSGNDGTSRQCEIEGTTTPFDPARLKALYPTHRAYVTATVRAAAAGVTAGFLLPPDAADIVKTAIR